MVGIYLIENKITKECYIGQSRNIENRFRSHRANLNNKKYSLYTDMRFYGLDNFSFSIIETCSINELDEKEMYWITKYNDDGRALYNIIGVPEKERNYVRRKYKKPFKKHRPTSNGNR